MVIPTEYVRLNTFPPHQKNYRFDNQDKFQYRFFDKS